MTATPTPTKSGYKTTEFWLSALATIFGLLMASDVVPTESIWGKVVGIAVAALATMGYTASRARAKSS